MVDSDCVCRSPLRSYPNEEDGACRPVLLNESWVDASLTGVTQIAIHPRRNDLALVSTEQNSLAVLTFSQNSNLVHPALGLDAASQGSSYRAVQFYPLDPAFAVVSAGSRLYLASLDPVTLELEHLATSQSFGSQMDGQLTFSPSARYLIVLGDMRVMGFRLALAPSSPSLETLFTNALGAPLFLKSSVFLEEDLVLCSVSVQSKLFYKIRLRLNSNTPETLEAIEVQSTGRYFLLREPPNYHSPKNAVSLILGTELGVAYAQFSQNQFLGLSQREFAIPALNLSITAIDVSTDFSYILIASP